MNAGTVVFDVDKNGNVLKSIIESLKAPLLITQLYTRNFNKSDEKNTRTARTVELQLKEKSK